MYTASVRREWGDWIADRAPTPVVIEVDSLDVLNDIELGNLSYDVVDADASFVSDILPKLGQFESNADGLEDIPSPAIRCLCFLSRNRIKELIDGGHINNPEFMSKDRFSFA